jgi:hypothetical protein
LLLVLLLRKAKRLLPALPLLRRLLLRRQLLVLLLLKLLPVLQKLQTANCNLKKNDLLLHLPLRHLLLLPTALLPCRVDCHGKLPSTVRFKTTRGKTASMGSVICRSMENSLCERALEQLGKRKGIATPV